MSIFTTTAATLTVAACSLTVGPMPTHASGTLRSFPAQNAISASNQPIQPKVTPQQFKTGLADLVRQGKLKQLSSAETPYSTTSTYGVIDPKSGTTLITFATEIPKYQDRIWGAMWGWEPSLTFNPTDQEAISAGGAAAVTAMAAAAAVALSETVVGSVISAGVIAFVGGAATVYLAKYGKCPSSNPTLWVGVLTKKTACR